MDDKFRNDQINETLELVKLVWKTYPNLRLGQLMCIISNSVTGGNDSFHIEDNTMKAELFDILRTGELVKRERQ